MESIYSGSVRGGLSAERIRSRRRSQLLPLLQMLENRRRTEEQNAFAAREAEANRMNQLQRAQYSLHGQQLMQQSLAAMAEQERAAQEAAYKMAKDAEASQRSDAYLTLAQQAEQRLAAKANKPAAQNPTALDLARATDTPYMKKTMPVVDSKGVPIPGRRELPALTLDQQKTILEAGRAGLSLAEAARLAGLKGVNIDALSGPAAEPYNAAIKEANTLPWWRLGTMSEGEAKSRQQSLEAQRQAMKARMRELRQQRPEDMYWDGNKWAPRTPPQAAPTPEAARPMSQAEFDQLSSGAKYIDPEDGRLYRKP